ncbi:MAG: energy transducer TonB [Agriterribacter sp.]
MLRGSWIIIMLIGFTVIAHAQTIGDSSIKDQPVFSLAETAPAFPGGVKAFYSFVAENLVLPLGKPAQSRAKTVTARVVIDRNGKIAYGEIEEGINKDYNECVLNLIKKMPDWLPATQNGRAVPIWVTIPVIFPE